MKRLRAATAVAVIAVGLTAVPAASPAEAARAKQSKRCKAVETHDGGRSAYIRTDGRSLRCRKARRVAARADGSSYRAKGFDCEPAGEPGRYGLLYGCGRVTKSGRQGIGFFYRAP